MFTVMGIKAHDLDVDFSGSTAEVTKIMSIEGPRRIVGIDVQLEIVTTEEMDEKQRIILERVAKTCPVSLSLHPDIQQNIAISFKTA